MMSRISDKDIFLINAEYITNKIKIRPVFYATLLILALTIISVSSYKFSVNFSFEGKISQASILNSGDSNNTVTRKLVEIQLNQDLSELFKDCKNIQIEFLEDNIPFYRCKGEIIRFSEPLNADRQSLFKAIIAKTSEDDQIELFPSNLPENCSAEINIIDVKISLDNLLFFLTIKNLFSLELNQFS